MQTNKETKTTDNNHIGYTKGEWRLSSICPYSVIAGEDPPNQTDIACADIRNTIKLFANMPEDKEAMANAKLISAAPDLLENLIRIIDRIEEAELQNNFPSAYARAKQAIKKATE